MYASAYNNNNNNNNNNENNNNTQRKAKKWKVKHNCWVEVGCWGWK
jgi:hypothetical protein